MSELQVWITMYFAIGISVANWVDATIVGEKVAGMVFWPLFLLGWILSLGENKK